MTAKTKVPRYLQQAWWAAARAVRTDYHDALNVAWQGDDMGEFRRLDSAREGALTAARAAVIARGFRLEPTC